MIKNKLALSKWFLSGNIYILWADVCAHVIENALYMIIIKFIYLI